MRDKLEGEAPAGRARTTPEKPVVKKQAPPKARRKSETPTVTDDLTGKFLRVGNKLYRTSDDRKPIVRLEPDRLKTNNIDALPDIVRIAKANGWTSIRIDGGDVFKKAAFLAAAAQGLDVENYTPSKVLKAEAERLRARLSERETRRAAKSAPAKPGQPTGEIDQRKALAERFLKQSNEENARDPDLRRAQTLVAQAISIGRAQHPDDPDRGARDAEAKRQEVATRIANGDRIAAIQIRNQQTERVREVTQDQTMKRDNRSR
ncbi:MAG: LPD7 domain-containing protein [Candidatus Binataceae bacterium]